jgi:hypothetical protein
MHDEIVLQHGDMPIIKPKWNKFDAESQDTRDDSIPKAPNPTKEEKRQRTVSTSAKGDTHSLKIRYEKLPTTKVGG